MDWRKVSQRTCVNHNCSNPAALGELVCQRCDPTLAPPVDTVIDDAIKEFLDNPYAGTIVPTEEVERFSRALRQNYVACINQGFTDSQSMAIVLQMVDTILTNSAD